jgi:hypothetical protein
MKMGYDERRDDQDHTDGNRHRLFADLAHETTVPAASY